MSFENYSFSPAHIAVIGLLILIWIIAGALICIENKDDKEDKDENG